MHGIEKLQALWCAKIEEVYIGYGFNVIVLKYLITMMGMIAHIAKFQGPEEHVYIALLASTDQQ